MKKSSEKIIELTNTDQWLEAFPVINQLRRDLTKNSFLELLLEMRDSGYKLIALYDKGKIASVAGIGWKVNFYNKRHIYVYDLVTDESKRSYGFGEKLLTYIHNYAKKNGADYIALESAIQRVAAHHFYEQKFHYDKWCYSFRKKL